MEKTPHLANISSPFSSNLCTPPHSTPIIQRFHTLCVCVQTRNRIRVVFACFALSFEISVWYACYDYFVEDSANGFSILTPQIENFSHAKPFQPIFPLLSLVVVAGCKYEWYWMYMCFPVLLHFCLPVWLWKFCSKCFVFIICCNDMIMVGKLIRCGAKTAFFVVAVVADDNDYSIESCNWQAYMCFLNNSLLNIAVFLSRDLSITTMCL